MQPIVTTPATTFAAPARQAGAQEAQPESAHSDSTFVNQDLFEEMEEVNQYVTKSNTVSSFPPVTRAHTSGASPYN